MTILSVNNLTVKYDTTTILEDVTFSISKGDFVCVVGKNGCGKSTLVKSILGLVKVYNGDISFQDKQNNIGYLAQSSNIQDDFPASVKEIVLSSLLRRWNKFYYNKQDLKKAYKIMDLLSITPYIKKPFYSLSGGTKQRVLLARAILAANDILILDEPFNALDPLITKELFSILHSINKDLGITVIMVCHNINLLTENVNKVLHLEKSVLFYGDINDYVNSEIGKEFFRS